MANKEEELQVEVLEKFVKKSKDSFTISDVIAATGLPAIETEYGLKKLMGRYHTNLKVTSGGDLLYDFGKNPTRRDAVTWGERWDKVKNFLWSGFKAVYKTMTSLILIVYFIIFLVMLVAMIIAVMSGGKDDKDKGNGAGNIIGGLLRMMASIFDWTTYRNRTYIARDDWGYDYRHYQPRETSFPKKGRREEIVTSKTAKDKSFVASIFDFIFGPPKVKLDPLANKKELVTYLRQNKGLVTTSELQALAGFTREEAEDFMTSALAEFDGKADISSEGTLFADFSELLRSTHNSTERTPVVYYWDEYEPAPELTGNTTWRNIAISGMNTFNLAMSSLLMFSNIGAELGMGSLFWLGGVPFVYSILFFLIPLFRSFGVRKEQKKQHANNIRKRILKILFERYQQEISLDELIEIANKQRSTEEKLSPARIKDIVQDLVYDMKGDSWINDKGQIVYRFHDLQRELSEIETIRQEKRSNNQIGDIVFDTKE